MKLHPFSKLLLSIFLFSAIFFSSCQIIDKYDDYMKPTYHPQYGLPLAHGKLSIFEVVKDVNNILVKNPDSSLDVVFHVNSFDVPLGDFIAFKPAFTSDALFSINNLLLAGFNVSNQNMNVDLSTGLASPVTRLIEMNVASGLMDITIQNNLQITLKALVVKFPGATIAGLPVPDASFDSIPAGTSKKITVDVSGYKFNLRGTNGLKVNTIQVKVLSDSTKNQGNVTQYNLLTDNARLLLDFDNLSLQKGIGNFGAFKKDFSDTINFFGHGFYDNIVSGGLLLNNATMNLNIENTAGVPYVYNLHLKTRNGNNGQVDSLSPMIANTLKRATENPLASDPANNQLIKNPDYTLNQVLSNIPGELYNNITIKDTSNVNNFSNFMYPDSKASCSIDLKIPMDVNFKALTLQDTFGFNFANALGDQLSNTDTTHVKLESGFLIFNTDNGFPFDFNFNASLYDTAGAFIDSLFKNEFIKAAPVNTDDKVISPFKTTFSIPISQHLFDNLKRAAKLKVIYSIDNKSNPKNYNIYTYYNLDFKVAAELKLRRQL